jgi:hypothetical protein
MIPSLVAVTKSVEAGHEARILGEVDPQQRIAGNLERRGSPGKCKQERCGLPRVDRCASSPSVTDHAGR